MKAIGLIGGMSWESSLEYYKIINETTKKKLGELHSAKSLMFSFDFHEIEELQNKGDWQSATEMMVKAAGDPEKGGAELPLICTNTMHKMADEVAASVNIPLLQIADTTAQVIRAQGLKKVALLCTKFTMEENFYKGRLEERHGIDAVVPDETDRQIIHDIIYSELCLGEIKETSRQSYLSIIKKARSSWRRGCDFRLYRNTATCQTG